MLNGPFQRLPGSSEGWNPNAYEPWLLPISDTETAPAPGPDAIALAVRQASRPLWIAANALCVALGLLLAVETATGWMSSGTSAVAPVTTKVLASASAS
ncbi:hypothetical protein [Methylobacterium planeticum]|uniref:Uncharacterized protein n=1 Tax=Methylobacterium planeticum TaxID=2615211 RepID=A0A6N6MLB4_9HYPH|nr:hypothetical protein [Methylobacterium planeticum]KAB1070512.1 hypothetical protein F6X51_22545 [Methylobacterium planeticum]